MIDCHFWLTITSMSQNADGSAVVLTTTLLLALALQLSCCEMLSELIYMDEELASSPIKNFI